MATVTQLQNSHSKGNEFGWEIGLCSPPALPCPSCSPLWWFQLRCRVVTSCLIPSFPRSALVQPQPLVPQGFLLPDNAVARWEALGSSLGSFYLIPVPRCPFPSLQGWGGFSLTCPPPVHSVRTQAGASPVFPHLPLPLGHGGDGHQQHQHAHQHVFQQAGNVPPSWDGVGRVEWSFSPSEYRAGGGNSRDPVLLPVLCSCGKTRMGTPCQTCLQVP